MSEYAEFWRRARRQADLTQVELSLRLGWRTAHLVSNIERGLAKYGQSSLRKLIVILNLDIEDVVDLIMRQEKKRLDQALKKICGTE